jgi:hypothetical protein
MELVRAREINKMPICVTTFGPPPLPPSSSLYEKLADEKKYCCKSQTSPHRILHGRQHMLGVFISGSKISPDVKELSA